MTTPLIIQIQEAAIDSNASLTDALRKAKIACVKLGLTDFGVWVDKELNGYDGLASELPEYRIIYGRPEVYNRYHGWQPIQFKTKEQLHNFSHAPVGMSISAIEDSLPDASSRRGNFSFPYSPEVQEFLQKALNGPDDTRIKIEVPQIIALLNSVRNILLNWTLELEQQGVLGENLMFSSDERKKSASVTASTVNHINIAQVGSFVQNADNSTVQGSIEANVTENILAPTLDLVRQVEAILPVSNLPADIHEKAQSALGELKEAAADVRPDNSRLKKGLETLKRVLAPAGETLVKLAVDAAVTKILTPG